MKNGPEHLEIYDLLAGLHHSFDQLLNQLDILRQQKSFRIRLAFETVRVTLEETRAELSLEIMEVLQEQEESEWTRLGRLRRASEKKLEDPNDVLIEAEKRKAARKRRAKK